MRVLAHESHEFGPINRYHPRCIVCNANRIDIEVLQRNGTGEYNSRKVGHVFQGEGGKVRQARQEMSCPQKRGKFPWDKGYMIQGERLEQSKFALQIRWKALMRRYEREMGQTSSWNGNGSWNRHGWQWQCGLYVGRREVWKMGRWRIKSVKHPALCIISVALLISNAYPNLESVTVFRYKIQIMWLAASRFKLQGVGQSPHLLQFSSDTVPTILWLIHILPHHGTNRD